MAYRLTYYKEAKQDIHDAKIWYHKQLPGLERRFALDIKRVIIRLKTNPHIHAIRYKKVRVAHPKVFPYSVHFFVDEVLKCVVVIGVIHDSRDFEFLKQRK